MKITLISVLLVTFTINGICQQNASLVFEPVPSKPVIISKHIYGHFSEHLGRCIYDGFWVDENSTIPNKNRIRTDIVSALKKYIFRTSDGLVVVLLMNIIGETEQASRKAGPKWSMPIGEESQKIIVLELMSSWSFVKC